VVFIGFTAASVFVLRHRPAGSTGQASASAGGAGLRVPGYPVTPIVFLFFVVVLLGVLLMNSPREALTGAAIAAVGLPVYGFIRKQPPGE
jgi:basic amino acid/polyamine antiporter, APA family